MRYESSLELACVLHCQELGLKVENYTLSPIVYFDTKKKKNRKYFPDFIINDFIIAEVKHTKGFIYENKKQEIEDKKRAAIKFCDLSDRYSFLFITNDMIDKSYVGMAKKIHKKRKK